MRLWDAAGISLNEAILAFTVGDDPILDRELVPFDCLASAAHATALQRVGLLEQQELEQLLQALGQAKALADDDKFDIAAEQEDGHTALEVFLTEKVGDAGRRIHTGRSRNDQVIAALRLLLRERLLNIGESTLDLAQALLERAAQNREVLMPGYTHTRQGMPSTVAQLLCSAAEGLLSDVIMLEGPLRMASTGALGSASGYGVPLPLDRQAAADLLGLDSVDINTIHVQNTRGKLEAAVIAGLHAIATTLARVATDLIWFSSEAFGFFALPLELTTGSSIMPQKRNPDVLELVRAVPASMQGAWIEVTSTLGGLASGYHRDLQRTKEPVLRTLSTMRSTIEVMQHATRGLEVNPERCAAAMEASIYATDRAYALVRAGTPFREAYREVKESEAQSMPADEVLGSRQHLGAPGTDQESLLMQRVTEARARLQPFREGADKAASLLS